MDTLSPEDMLEVAGDIMEAAEKNNISGSYFMNKLAIVATLATLQELEEKNGVNHLWSIGGQLSDGLRGIIQSSKLKAEVIGVPAMPFLIFGNKEDHTKLWQEVIYAKGDLGSEKDKQAMRIFYNEMIKKGVFFV